MIKIKKHCSILVIFIMAAIISGCLATNSIRYGELKNGVYQSSTNEFSMIIPAGAKMFDDRHPLGRYLIISNLPEPVVIQGISYYQAVQPKNGLSAKAAKNMIKTGHDFWAKSYEQTPMKVVHEEWIKIDDKPAYFTLVQGSNKSNHYNMLSFMRGNYSYVLFEKVNTDKQQFSDKKGDLSSIQKFYKTVKFRKPDSIKFQAK